MKKIFTLFAISAMMIANAQTNLFKGSDMENFTDFMASLNGYGLTYGGQLAGAGVNGSASLHINASTTSNVYDFTANATETLPTNIKSITLRIKGTADVKSLSFNVYLADGTYVPFNLGSLAGSDVVLSPSASNDYNGSIDTGGKFVKVVLDCSSLTNINRDNTKSIFAMKMGKNANFILDVDDIKVIDATLAVSDISKSKLSLVKNTNVSNSISFAKAANIQIVNASGQVVKSASVNENTPLNVSSLPKGIYIVTGTLDGQKVSQKIMKN